MKIGISTASFYPLPTEESLLKLGNSGVNTTEIFFNSISELSDDFISKLNEIKSFNGINVTAVHPFTSGYEPYLFSRSYPRRYNDTLDLYRRYANAGAKLGAKFLVLHGDRPMTKDRIPEYCEHFAKLSRVIEQEGIMLTQENVNKFCAESPDFIRSMVENLGNRAMFTFDVKQCVRAGYSPWEIYDAMRGHIAHIHLSDHLEGNDCMLCGRGEFPFEKLFRIAIADGYDGAALIEVYSNAYVTDEQLINSYKTLLDKYNSVL